MRTLGFARSRQRLLVDMIFAAGAAALAGIAGFVVMAGEEQLPPYTIVGNAIPEPLTGTVGDPVAGRAIVLDRRLGACLLCHAGPYPEEKLQGTLAPDLSGAGSRWTPGELRLRLVDPTRFNPATIMPNYYRVGGLIQVGSAWRGKPILTAAQIEDVVAFLSTLRD
jgi:L-cysteine S-thiosulfotransferase